MRLSHSTNTHRCMEYFMHVSLFVTETLIGSHQCHYEHITRAPKDVEIYKQKLVYVLTFH